VSLSKTSKADCSAVARVMVTSIKFCCVQPVYINYLIRKQEAQYLKPGRQQQEKRLRELYWEELVVCYGGNCCVQQ